MFLFVSSKELNTSIIDFVDFVSCLSPAQLFKSSKSESLLYIIGISGIVLKYILIISNNFRYLFVDGKSVLELDGESFLELDGKSFLELDGKSFSE